MLWNDFRFALRVLRRSPLCAVACALTLTLAIGATAADAIEPRSLALTAPREPAVLDEEFPQLHRKSHPCVDGLRENLSESRRPALMALMMPVMILLLAAALRAGVDGGQQ